MGNALTKTDIGWIEQQIAIRIGFIKGFLTDINLLNYHPEYRSDFFNETLLCHEIRHQRKCIEELRLEIKRREIP